MVDVHSEAYSKYKNVNVRVCSSVIAATCVSSLHLRGLRIKEWRLAKFITSFITIGSSSFLSSPHPLLSVTWLRLRIVVIYEALFLLLRLPVRLAFALALQRVLHARSVYTLAVSIKANRTTRG